MAADLGLHCLLMPVCPNTQDKYGLQYGLAKTVYVQSIKTFYTHQCILMYLYADIEGCEGRSSLFAYEPVHDKTYNKIRATSEDSDQPAHLRSLIRVFAG